MNSAERSGQALIPFSSREKHSLGYAWRLIWVAKKTVDSTMAEKKIPVYKYAPLG
jgi:hypothetical protein